MSAVNKRAAVFGGGVIGGGWVARFLLMGWDVSVYDPDPEAPRKVSEVVANAKRSLPALYETSLPVQGNLSFAKTVAEAVHGASWVSECVPERLDIKHKVIGYSGQLCRGYHYCVFNFWVSPNSIAGAIG